MKRNVGSSDRVIRIVIGLGVAIAGVIYQSYWGLIGIPILATGIFGMCWVYSLLGISTKKEVV